MERHCQQQSFEVKSAFVCTHVSLQREARVFHERMGGRCANRALEFQPNDNDKSPATAIQSHFNVGERCELCTN